MTTTHTAPDSTTGTPQMANAMAKSGTLSHIKLPIKGMTCAACSTRLEKVLNKADGITRASVNLAMETAEIDYDPAAIDAGDMAKIVADAGFEVPTNKIFLDVEGMTCSACSARVEKALRKTPGVIDTAVNAATDRAEIVLPETLDDKDDISALIKAIEETGYSARPHLSASARHKQRQAEQAAQQAKTARREWIMLAISAGLSLPLVIQMALHMLGVDARMPGLVELALATPVQFWIGARFYRGAFHALRGGMGNMDVLVALGTSAAYFFSLYTLFRDGAAASGNLYFEASSIIITLILLGKLLEARAKRGTTAAISGLMALRPDVARIERNGEEVSLPVEDVTLNDIVIIKPGERIPVDGEIIDGSSFADESLLTGESLPVNKQPGDAITAGALNGTGLIRARVTKIGRDTTLSKIIELVENAQSGKAPVQRLVDRVSAIFVPTIIAIALVTFIGWMIAGGGFEKALIAAVAVLVIACPCALGLATPTAIVAGTGAAARAGILFKDVEALETAHRVDTVIFDKTGTLTKGAPAVEDFYAEGFDRDELIALTAALQASNEHPLAKAMVEYGGQHLTASKAKPVVKDAKIHTGFGVSGIVNGKQVRIGNTRFMEAEGISTAKGLPAQIAANQQTWQTEGKTAVLVAVDGHVVGLVGIADPLRQQSAQTIKILKKADITPIMLTGDAPKTAKHIADKLGIDTFKAETKPQDKAAFIADLQAQGKVVAMVGDGINDAPALALADIGIAMGSGADVAMETAAVTLMRADPLMVPAALEISRRTWSKLWQNLAWAFFYNLIGLPFAALGLLSPAIAGAAMAMSSVSVVTSSLMLRGWKPKF